MRLKLNDEELRYILKLTECAGGSREFSLYDLTYLRTKIRIEMDRREAIRIQQEIYDQQKKKAKKLE